jgi:hypothetical protein
MPEMEFTLKLTRQQDYQFNVQFDLAGLPFCLGKFKQDP